MALEVLLIILIIAQNNLEIMTLVLFWHLLIRQRLGTLPNLHVSLHMSLALWGFRFVPFIITLLVLRQIQPKGLPFTL